MGTGVRVTTRMVLRLAVAGAKLVWYRIPSARCAWIEDVVVDTAARGQGVGAALVRAALRHATEIGIRTVYLETTASRAAAIRLYRRLGFERREAEHFRISLAPP